MARGKIEKRGQRRRKIKPVILIVTEGSQTEPSLYKTFLWESAYYGIIASVIGSVLGYVCTIFIEAATSDTLQLVAIPVIPILEATLLAVGACLMATAIPLRKISKMSIVDSIETVE